MKDQMLKIAGVKSEKDFYKKYPTEEAFMAKHGKAFKKAAMGKSMVYKQLNQLTDWDGVPKADGGADLTGIANQATGWGNAGPVNKWTGQIGANAVDAKGNPVVTMAGTQAAKFDPSSASYGDVAGNVGMSLLGNVGQIIGGVQKIQEQKRGIQRQEGAAKVSGLVSQAAGTRERVQQKYVRPEDYLMQPGQMGSPTGVGTSYLEDGGMIGGNPTEIQNIYNPGDIYTDGGYEPIESQNIKQFKKGGYLAKAEFGDYFQDSGQADIGGAAGEAIGNALLPGVGGQVGKLLGKVAGNLLGGADDANKMARLKQQTETNQAQAAYQQAMQGQFKSYMEYGGAADKEHAWVSNGWQPQVIAKFGEYNVKDLLKPPHDADMLRAGGHLKEYTPPSAEAMFTGRPPLEPLTMNTGGRLPRTNMMFDTDKYPRAESGDKVALEGDLKIHGKGKAEPISYNPYLPGDGETIMFKGPSHDNGGIDISYGENGVEVEGGEPAVKLQDGGDEGNMVVFGNMPLPKFAADDLGISKASGKKFKHIANDISKNERKQNKIIDKATETADMTTGNSGFDQLRLNTSQAQLIGANMKLKNSAALKQNLAHIQNAILDTASQLGVKSDELAKGKFVKETDPRMMAETGKNIPYSGTPYADASDLYPGPTPRELVSNIVSSALSGVPSTEEYTQIPYQAGYTPTQLPLVTVTSDKLSTSTNINPEVEKAEKNKFDWKSLGQLALSEVSPFLRPRTRLPLDPYETMPEMYALATNQLEPVQAQTFQPMFGTPTSISLQDQIENIDSQSRAAIRAAGSNPAAQAAIMSQAIEAKNRVKGEEFRMNQAAKDRVYEANRNLANQAQLQNLQILDNQYVRQAQAKSNTKAQALEALKSIAAKYAANKLEEKTMNVYENMYKYRFSPEGIAYNVNDPAQFTIPNVGSTSTGGSSKVKDVYEKLLNRDKYGNVTGSKEKSRVTTGRNGAIVKALKNL